MLDWVENRQKASLKEFEVLSWLLFPAYKLSRKNTQPENMCDIAFEKAKGCGRAENRKSVSAEAAVRRVL